MKADLDRRIARSEKESFARVYRKPYPTEFDSAVPPTNWRLPEFVRFSGDDSKTTLEHISQYLAQLGEAGSMEALRVRYFSLSLTGTAFSWFSSLGPSSISSWEQLEQKFHEHFYDGTNEMKLSNLTSVKQRRDESVSDYIRRFKDVKNRCFRLTIGEKDVADLAFDGLRSHIKDRLENIENYHRDAGSAKGFGC